jgi:hypothetical protein
MAPVPAFDGRGLIPPFIGSDPATGNRSPYKATMTEIAMTLGTTQHRRDLLKGLLAYREMLGQIGYVSGMQFVDGSFAENVELREARDPNDIDVFSYRMVD